MNNVDDILVTGVKDEVKDAKDIVQPEITKNSADEVKADIVEMPTKKEREREIEPDAHDDESGVEYGADGDADDGADVEPSTLPEAANAEDNDPDSEVDEYGTKVKKQQRLYTEEELQQRIRERLKRGNHPDVQQPQPKSNSEGFQFDENSDLGWQEQLELFIEQTQNKIEQKKAAKLQEEREARALAEHQGRFTSGMSRYPDFVQTLQDKPVTDAMVLATRGMKDPAAFLYAAAKNFPKELERISQIQDAFHQATEIGRLEERMRKPKVLTASPKPVKSDRTDVTEKAVNDRPSIESRIHSHARSKLRR
jgi:hypothetical protein